MADTTPTGEIRPNQTPNINDASDALLRGRKMLSALQAAVENPETCCDDYLRDGLAFLFNSVEEELCSAQRNLERQSKLGASQ